MTWETGKSLLEYGLRRANELDKEPNDDFVADYKDYLNLAYWDIIGEFPWSWAMKYPPGQVTTIARVGVTAQCAEGSPVVTLTSTPSSSWVGRKFVLENDGIPMRIIGTGAGDSITLAAPYPHDGNGPGSIFQDEYVLPSDVMMPVRMRRLMYGGEVELIQPQLFLETYKANVAWGSIHHYTYLTNKYIQIGYWPEKAQPLEYWYTLVPPEMDFSGAAATDTPIMPHHLRWIIADRALYYLLSDMEDSKAVDAVGNSSIRLNEEKAREIAKMAPRFWIPRRFRFARSRG